VTRATAPPAVALACGVLASGAQPQRQADPRTLPERFGNNGCYGVRVAWVKGRQLLLATIPYPEWNR
jgi:hypothetical protein